MGEYLQNCDFQFSINLTTKAYPEDNTCRINFLDDNSVFKIFVTMSLGFEMKNLSS
jgi:hypothetical protein